MAEPLWNRVTESLTGLPSTKMLNANEPMVSEIISAPNLEFE